MWYLAMHYLNLQTSNVWFICVNDIFKNLMVTEGEEQQKHTDILQAVLVKQHSSFHVPHVTWPAFAPFILPYIFIQYK